MKGTEQKDQIRSDVSNHALFSQLDEVQQRVITSDVYVHWFWGIKDLANRDRNRTAELIKNHSHINAEFKPIYLDIL
ncbi:hypothetical protein [Sphingobacterium litopenaei]|uniref:Uncharacterized protein n=1 Tax=Sphingobacterium litopenaei TaxID=2763500 RepID=A0ABR7YH98_9SPHI|nr:hypothetical protein [Sphingobacterium litopenaei]MBD1430609.1 hypothetical protein [Sphingobacterium litopenaei]